MQAQLANLDLEMAFAKEIVKGVREWYSICSSHREHQWNKDNHVPAIRFDIRDVLWKIEFPDGANEEGITDRLLEDFWDQWHNDDYPNELEKEMGFKPFFDMNGYRLLCNVRINDIESEIAEKEQDLAVAESDEQPDQEIIEEFREEITELQSKYIEQAKAIGNFLEWAPGFISGWDEYYLKDMVFVINDDGEYDYVHHDSYEDRKDDEGWRKVVKQGKKWKIIDERTKGNKKLQEVLKV